MEEKARAFVLEVFADIKSAWGGRVKTRDEKRRELGAKRAVTKPFEKGRDPRKIDSVLGQLVKDRGWQTHFAETEIIANWPQIVGEQIAARTQIIALAEGVLTVQAYSQNWLTALRLNRQQILDKINQQYPAAKIQSLKLLPPGTLSWKHGKYVLKGRGPRDTYDPR